MTGDQAAQGGPGGAGRDRNHTLPHCLEEKLGQPNRGSKNIEETREGGLVNPKTRKRQAHIEQLEERIRSVNHEVRQQGSNTPGKQQQRAPCAGARVQLACRAACAAVGVKDQPGPLGSRPREAADLKVKMKIF